MLDSDFIKVMYVHRYAPTNTLNFKSFLKEAGKQMYLYAKINSY